MNPVMAGIGILGAGIKLFQNGDQRKRQNAILNSVGTYQADEGVAGNVSLAANLYNGRMAGAAQAEQNIEANQANAQASVNRNATDASQALAIASGLQGQTNSSLLQLGAQEGQNRQQMFGNLQQATQANAQQKYMAFQDKLRQAQDRAQINATYNANLNSAIGDLSGSANMALGGMDLSKMFGGRGIGRQGAVGAALGGFQAGSWI